MSEEPESSPPVEPELEELVEKISTEHGFDVRGYKRTTLYRRIRKRMLDVGCASLGDYLVRLETDRHEYGQLINTILINVTEFFRDPEAWAYLEEHCLAPLLRSRGPGAPLRIWSAGCATGEEAYSLAIAFSEAMGDRSLRDLKIYATDVDESALATARTGIYGLDDLRNVSPERLERCFEELPGGRYAIRRDLRSCVIFGRHNVLVDPPISRLDLLVCRNLLIYFDNETQQQLLGRFHYALRSDGYLFLGKAETLMARSRLFRPVEARFRVFQRVPHAGGIESMLGNLEPRRLPREPQASPTPAIGSLLRSLVEQSPDVVLLLDGGNRMLLASEAARDLFGITDTLVGKSFLELEEGRRPVALRLAMEDVRATGRAVMLEEARFERAPGELCFIRLEVRALPEPQGEPAQLLITGRDLTQEKQLQAELMQARQELETVSEELQTTNEELETTNEELETTNEELQSTNEELETTVEELQSTNEELETANDELRSRETELNTLTRYQELVLSSLEVGVAVLNRACVVTSWNKLCEETWGLREEEAVAQEFFSLDIGLPLDSLREPLQRVLSGTSKREALEVAATNRRGRAIGCTLRVTPLLDAQGERAGLVLVIQNGDRVPGQPEGAQQEPPPRSQVHRTPRAGKLPGNRLGRAGATRLNRPAKVERRLSLAPDCSAPGSFLRIASGAIIREE